MKKIIILLLTAFTFIIVKAQDSKEGKIHGNFQTDMQIYKNDTLIGAFSPDEKMLMNSYANINYSKGNFSAGIRYEGYLNTLQGFNSGNDGVGIPIRWATYIADEMEVTVGNFYEQFGNGLILRAYEEKGIDYDNAFDGVRVKYKPFRGIFIKGLAGKQRLYFEKGPGIVRGIDGEISINELITKLTDKKTQIIIGGGFVSKFQEDMDPVLKLPENVGAWSGRFQATRGKVSLSGEYAYKINDPSADNRLIYKPGDAILMNMSFSQKGLGIIFSAKRIDNMSFRSDRSASLNNLSINCLPSITKNHIYSLAAVYPYATQPNGEIGFQGGIMYKFKKNTLMGGKNGTNVSVNFSKVNSLSTTLLYDGDGYKSDYSKIGDDIYYQDFNIELTKKFGNKIKTIFTYLNLIYNYDVIRGMTGHGKIYADVFIADITYKLNEKNAIRTELQSLICDQDMGDWAMALLEYSISPHWFFSLMDQYNYGNPEKEKQLHYYNVSVGFIKNANRIQMGYGRQREGIMCVGGVCRNVPAANGFTISITSSF